MTVGYVNYPFGIIDSRPLRDIKIQITNTEQENYFIQNMRNFRCFMLYKTVNELVSVVGRIHTHDGWMKDNLCNRRNKIKRPGNKNDP